VEQEKFAAKLSFVCSPEAVELLDKLKVKYRCRSRGELLRRWLEWALTKERIIPAVRASIEEHHDRLNGTAPCRRSPVRQPQPLRKLERKCSGDRFSPSATNNGIPRAPAAPSTDGVGVL
jgi:hypothetical protein